MRFEEAFSSIRGQPFKLMWRSSWHDDNGQGPAVGFCKPFTGSDREVPWIWATGWGPKGTAFFPTADDLMAEDWEHNVRSTA